MLARWVSSTTLARLPGEGREGNAFNLRSSKREKSQSICREFPASNARNPGQKREFKLMPDCRFPRQSGTISIDMVIIFANHREFPVENTKKLPLFLRNGFLKLKALGVRQPAHAQEESVTRCPPRRHRAHAGGTRLRTKRVRTWCCLPGAASSGPNANGDE